MTREPAPNQRSRPSLLSRRRFLGTSAALGAGAVFPSLLHGRAARSPRATSVIHIFLPGGMAQQESFDPKPYAPAEYRGPFRAIPTTVDGLQFSELFSKTARVADKLTVIQSMTHGEAAHERGAHNMLTGYRPSPALIYPSIGAVVAHELGPKTDLPPYVCIPRPPNEFAGSGYLSSAFGPFSVLGEPSSRNFSVRNLAPPKAIDADRQARRRRLLEVVDADFKDRVSSDDVAAMQSFQERAYALVGSEAARSAFDIAKEDKKTRDRYGKNRDGQRLLLARRLVEGGARYVTVSAGSWDHHDDISRGMRSNAPNLDRAFAALIADLDERGRLDETLVLLTSEFGRTPMLNDTNGRDHWPRVFSVVAAGGGIKRGHVHGTSDAMAAEPDDDPVGIEDLAATVYHQLGIDAERELIAPGDRPIEIVKGGRVLRSILA